RLPRDRGLRARPAGSTCRGSAMLGRSLSTREGGIVRGSGAHVRELGRAGDRARIVSERGVRCTATCAVGSARSADRLAGGLGATRRLALAAVVPRPVGPAVARLARRAEVDVDELAGRVDADAERALVGDADVEGLGELVELADRDVLDLDVHRRGVEVAAGV